MAKQGPLSKRASRVIRGIRWFFGEYFRRRRGVVGFVMLVVFVLIGIFGPMLAPHDPRNDDKLAEGFAAPSWVTILPFYGNEPPTQELAAEPSDWNVEASDGVRVESFDTGAIEMAPVTRGGDPVTLEVRNGFDIVAERAGSLRMELPYEYPYSGPRNFTFRYRYNISSIDTEGRILLSLISPDGTRYPLHEESISRESKKQIEWNTNAFRACVKGFQLSGETCQSLLDQLREEFPEKMNQNEEVWLNRVAQLLFDDPGEYRFVIDLRFGEPSESAANEATEGNADDSRSNGASPLAEMSIYQSGLSIPGTVWGVLGTDHAGRDVFSQVLYGAQVSLLIGLISALGAMLIGLIVGIVSGFIGGAVDEILMRVTDMMLSLPIIAVFIVLSGVSEGTTSSIVNLIFLISLFFWMPSARVIRSQTLSLKERAFIEASKGLGAKEGYLMMRHIFPNVLPLVIASWVLLVPTAITLEAIISFLALGDPRIVSWGWMLGEGYRFAAFADGIWWVIVPPGLALTLISLAFVLIGDTLDEMFNPQSKER